MLNTKFICVAALLAFFTAATAFAQQPIDKRTLFTFSGPVRMPGVTLAPGQYLFRLADTNTRGVVQVLSSDGKKIFGTFFTIPAMRSAVPDQPEVGFMEAAATAPIPVRTWWYPGETTGFEFIYPKRDATRLAKAARESVLTTQSQTSTMAETNTKSLSRISASGTETNVARQWRLCRRRPRGRHSRAT